jgi:ankyrin repeat protein
MTRCRIHRFALIVTALLVFCQPFSLGGVLSGGRPELYQEAMNGDLDATRQFVQNPKKLEHTDHSGRHLLHWLARFGHDEALLVCLDAGADVDFRITRKNAVGSHFKSLLDESRMEGATPLFVAASAGNSWVVRPLIEHGADVNAVTADGSTPLIAAGRRGCLECAKLLLERGADANHANGKGITPLLAVGQGQVGIHALRTLLKEWELDWFHTLDYSPDRAELVSLLIEHGADAGAKTPEGESLLYLAARHDYPEVVDTLIESGVPPDEATTESRTPALAAASFDHVQVVDRLIEAGAQPVVARELVRDIHGTAVLHERAARYFERQGERQAAYENFVIAAEYFEMASNEFERVARLRKKKVARQEAINDLLNAILEASLAASSQIQMRETAKLAALRDAVNSGSGLGGYYAALDKRYREYAALSWSEATVTGIGNLSLDQQLSDAEWVPVLAKRSLMALHASAHITEHLRTEYADLRPPLAEDLVTRLLLRTRQAWLDGALDTVSKAFKEDATHPSDIFLDSYNPQVRSMLERANEMQPLDEEEFLAAFQEDKFLLTSHRFYVLAGTPRAIPLDRIVKYKVKLSAMDLMIELDSGEKILFPDLKKFPKVELVETLNPAINRKSQK